MRIFLYALTCSRAPLAFLFLLDNTAIRLSAVILAMLTDSIDGWLARRYRYTSRFGAVLDPVMDKFFIYFILTILWLEHSIATWCALAMISRDFSLVIFAIYLIATRQLKACDFRAIIWGKVSTALQFATTICILIGWKIPNNFYFVFIFLSIFALIELFWLHCKRSHRKTIQIDETKSN
ncbi:MAG: CDP-alcohol phosphatidyltransferase family protein [Simkaniaceae bacterium]|nr:CDP-alcohol phosphatidyltransferase family protein [Simkaniaceae bacterium]MCF7852298.1 CDP-alcohol phosphatidyltransferase family protein [Simkaniaceae bacterium]